MFKNYWKAAYRSLIKRKWISFINIAGLAIGMTASFFVFQYVYVHSSYDNFHKNSSRLYRVGVRYAGEGVDPGSAANHPSVGPTMKAEFGEVEEYARLFPFSVFLGTLSSMGLLDAKANTMVSYDDGHGTPAAFYEDKIYLADASFLQMFSFPLTAGNAGSALTDPANTVISVSMAKKYFGNNDPLNKTILINGQWPLKVTGVFQDVPPNSHIHFDMLISAASLGNKFGNDIWTWPEVYTYILLKPGASTERLAAKLPDMMNRHMGDLMKTFNITCSVFLTPVPDIHLHPKFEYESEPQGSQTAVNLLAIIGGFILLIAWINYVNLSTAKSLDKSKEVGLRKIIGASRFQLISQFLTESLLLNVVALTVSALFIVVFVLFFPGMLQGFGFQGMLSAPLWKIPAFWLIVSTVFTLGILLTGAYPAHVLSGIQPVWAIKGKLAGNVQNISVRELLVTFQFVLSILLIAGTITVFRQLKYMQQTQPGYDRDQVLVIKAPSAGSNASALDMTRFTQEAMKKAGYRRMAFSSDIPGKALNAFNTIWPASKEETAAISTFMNEADENFIPLYDIKMAAGRNFTSHDSIAIVQATDARIIINETLARQLGYVKNADALQQRILFRPYGWVAKAEIVGVVRDYHQRSMKEAYDPMVYYYPNWNRWKYLSVKAGAGELERELPLLEQLYKSNFPGNSFEYFFLDDYFQAQYASDRQFAKVFSVFTLVAMIIACMGLLGLSSLMIHVRIREIGIRKVLGASIPGLLMLFSTEFIKLVAWASAISIPIIYFAANKWLKNYAFRVDVNLIILLMPSVMLAIISLLTTTIHSWKAALMNPVKTLKTE
jgi:putative ABC transport system permease protein